MDRLASMETFVSVVESGSFSIAARQLGVGQPAVSKSITQLEDKLGVRLLLRSTRGVVVTEAGQSFYEHARQSIDEADAAEKVESGAKSALDPHVAATVTSYVAQDLPDLDMSVDGVTTVKPERTFWDKIIILHGLRQWHDRRGELRHGGQRVSRHYYDVHQLMQAGQAAQWHADHALALDCARHARLFFGSADLGLDSAAPGTFTLTPRAAMLDTLARDYEAMAGMVFGEVPRLDAVLGERAAV